MEIPIGSNETGAITSNINFYSLFYANFIAKGLQLFPTNRLIVVDMPKNNAVTLLLSREEIED